MKTRHRWLTGVSSWKQMACWSLFGIVLHACALLPLESALAQDLAEPELKAAEAEEVKPTAADKDVLAPPASQVDAEGPQVVYENSINTRWKIGAKVRTGAGRAVDVRMTFPVPANWPEQTVTIAEQDIPVGLGTVTSRKLPAGVEQALVQFPVLPANDIFEVSYTLDIVNRAIIAPKETHGFIFPKHNKKEVKTFLAISKNVDHNHSKVRNKAKEIMAPHTTAWEKTEAIYDWVRQNIQIEDTQYHSARQTLKNLAGTNEDKTFLFVALCRSAKIPARIVFAKGSSYAEFMLAGPEGDDLHWFPCDVSGIREFGGLSEPRVILQKGDGIKVPEKKKAQKYVAEFMSCKGSKPRVGFFRAEIFEDQPQQ